MKRLVRIVLIFVFGVTVGAFAEKTKLAPDAFLGSGRRGRCGLLAVAESMLDTNDTWESIAIGRILYLSGQKEAGQARFDASRPQGDRKRRHSHRARVRRGGRMGQGEAGLRPGPGAFARDAP